MTKPGFFLAGGLFLCGALTGCGPSGDRPMDDGPKTHVVEIRQMKFVPDRLEVAQGDSVRWINRDVVAHNVAEERPGGWRSADLQTGESYGIRIEEKGTYICTLHPVMKGAIAF